MTLSPRARPFVIPLIVFSVTLVAVVAAIVVVVVSRSGPDTPAEPSDSCLVGVWRVTSHKEEVTLDSFGKVTFQGAGARVQLNADGTGVTDYGTKTHFEGLAEGQKIALDVAGKLTFGYAAADGRVSFSAMTSDATSTVYFNGEQYGSSTPFEGSTEPATYTCNATTLVQQTTISRTELART
jgi:hypothetical protein